MDPAKRNQRLSPLGGETVSITLVINFLFDRKQIHLSLEQKMVLNWMIIQVSNDAWSQAKYRIEVNEPIKEE
jgi:hypothetical protein